jgi:hypothetical protein
MDLSSPYTRQQRASNKPLHIRDLTTRINCVKNFRLGNYSNLGTKMQHIAVRKKVTLNLRELTEDT